MILSEELYTRYRAAVRVYMTHPSLSDVCATMGMSAKDYCDRWVESLGPILTTGNTANGIILDFDRAFWEAWERRFEGMN